VDTKLPADLADEDLGIRFRDCFSVKYLQSAVLFCRLAYRIEAEYTSAGVVSADERLRHEAFVLNAIFSSVAFLEATINELWSDAADNAYCYTDDKNEALLKAVGEKWNNENYFDRTPLPLKYQKVLEIGNLPLFPEDDPEFLGIKEIIAIRNYLMHYRREWIAIPTGPGAGAGPHAEAFGDRLAGRFAENPLAARNLPFFPDRCLGHGCAEWAVTTSLAFTDRFFAPLGLPPSYEGIRGELGMR
jgi:hypothetical protein